MIRPIDPLDVLRRKSSTGRPKVRVIADRDDVSEPMIEVQSAPINGASDGQTVFSADEAGHVNAQTLDVAGLGQFGADVDVVGGVTVGAAAGGTLTPTPAFEHGRVYKNSLLFAAAFVLNGTTFQAGLNIQSFTRNGVGTYTIVLATPASDALLVVPIACLTSPSSAPWEYFVHIGLVDASTVAVEIADSGGSGHDTTFSVALFHM